MTIVRSSRARLDAALGDNSLTLLLLTGATSGSAQAIHDKSEAQITEPFRKTFLIPTPEMLTPTEKQDWFNGQSERYAVIGGDARQVADQGTCEDLLLKSGAPSVMAIRTAFAKGDAL